MYTTNTNEHICICKTHLAECIINNDSLLINIIFVHMLEDAYDMQ